MKHSLPLISVVMPVYNGERTIRLAINSLINQTYPNWNCIIVNDGSTDNTRKILGQFESDHRFRIIHLDVNGGRGNARQIALENAVGEYLTYLDADDFYHPQKLECQIETFEKYRDIALCSTGVGCFDNSYKLRRFRGFAKDTMGVNYRSSKFPGFPASVMIKLSIAKRQKYNTKLDVGEDNDFIYKCLVGKNYVVINRILYYYEEIGIVTYRKFICYQIKYIKTVIETNSGIPLLVEITKEIPKFLMKTIFGYILGPDFFLLKRGKIVNSKDVEDYNQTLNSILGK